MIFDFDYLNIKTLNFTIFIAKEIIIKIIHAYACKFFNLIIECALSLDYFGAEMCSTDKKSIKSKQLVSK